MKFTPARTYALLLKQTGSLLTIIHCLEQQRDAWTTNHFASKQLDSERAANEVLTNELEAARARIQQLERELAAERRPIRDTRPGAGPATRQPIPCLGLLPKYKRYADELVEWLNISARHGQAQDRDDAFEGIGEDFAFLRSNHDRLENMITELDAAIAELHVDILKLPKGHPFRESARRYAGALARKAKG